MPSNRNIHDLAHQVLGIVLSMLFDLITLAASILIVATFPEIYSGGKFLTDKGCLIAILIFILLSGSAKFCVKVRWKTELFSLAIPVIFTLIFMPLGAYWTIRSFAFGAIPILAVAIILCMASNPTRKQKS